MDMASDVDATMESSEGDNGSNGGEESVGAPPLPSRRAALLRSGIILLVLFITFGIILPRFVDYGEVKDAFLALTIEQIALMTVLGAIAWFVTGQQFTVLIPGLTPLRGNAAYLILSGIGSSIPFGPWNLGVVWVVMRGWGVPLDAATSGVAVFGIVNTLGRFALPSIALLILAATGGLSPDRGPAFLIAIIGMVIFFVAAGTMLVVVNSRDAADRLGRFLGRLVAWILARLGRTEHPDVLGSIHKFQESLGEIVHRRGLAALGMTIIAQIPWCIAFITALRITGVPDDVVSAGEIIAVYALVGIITIIPISPGGAGVPELLYIAGLTTIAGPSWEGLITAGVFLFRLYAWFLPIPLAWILLKIVRRGQPMLPTTAELKSMASTST